jgi:iron complex transport system substrate-binding protein
MTVLLVATLASFQATSAAPRRVISLDYCADQFVLKLLPRERILGVSPDADAYFSYMRDHVGNLPRVRPVAEEVLLRRPDHIVRAYGGGPGMVRFLGGAGVPTTQIGHVDSLDAIRQSLRRIAGDLGVPERGEAVVAEMNTRLDRLPRASTAPEALYLTPSGYTAGSGTLIDDILRAAGLRNFQREPGWRSLPLERLAYERPDLVASARFHHSSLILAPWSSARHPLVRRRLREVPVVALHGAWTSCGGWFAMDAVEALARARPAARAR